GERHFLGDQLGFSGCRATRQRPRRHHRGSDHRARRPKELSARQRAHGVLLLLASVISKGRHPQALLYTETNRDATGAARATAGTEPFEYLERFYNAQGRHSALGYLSPSDVRARTRPARAGSLKPGVDMVTSASLGRLGTRRESRIPRSLRDVQRP